ncbi:MAG: hypothetical protein J5676_10760 [Bacteroidaceae bacterium]|nr:hypothetical protein [Bacteroidaceae bacterium]
MVGSEIAGYDKKKQAIGFIVYLDENHDVKWIDTRNGEKDRMSCVFSYIKQMFGNAKAEEKMNIMNLEMAKISILKQKPCKNLSVEDKRNFMKLVGLAYYNVLKGNIDKVEQCRIDAKDFVYRKNREIALTMYLQVSLMVVFVASFLGILDFCLWNNIYIGVCVIGILGAYVSIWIRYGNIQHTGLASKQTCYMESCSRLMVGAISALFAVAVVKCGVLNFHNLVSVSGRLKDTNCCCFVVAFFSGFCERFVPTLIETIPKK